MERGFGCCTSVGVGVHFITPRSSLEAFIEESPLKGGQFILLYSAVPIPGVRPGVGSCDILTSSAPILATKRGISPAFLLRAVNDDFDSLESSSAV